MRFVLPSSALVDRVGALVHGSVAGDPAGRRVHLVFIIERLLVGLAALAFVPVYLVAVGRPDAVALSALSAILLQLAAAGILSLSGRLVPAQTVASLAFAMVVLCLAMVAGAPLLALLAALPLDAARTASRRATIVAIAVGVLGLVFHTLASPMAFAALAPALATAFVLIALSGVAALRHIARAAAAHRHMIDAERRTAETLALAADVVAWQDRSGHVLALAGSFQSLPTTPPGELRGQGLFQRVHVADRPAYLKAIADVAHAGGVADIDIRLHAGPDGPGRGPAARTLDRPAAAARGGIVWMHMVVSRSAGGPPGTEVVAILSDIGDAKGRDAEAESRQAEAKRTSEMQARFLATVSHELRTPLNAIIGFSELLETRDASDEKGREYAGIIRQSGEHLLDLVNALLDVSKIESGSFDIEPVAFDPARLAKNCCDLIQLKADRAKVTLIRDWPGYLPELVADERACRQILINLLSNAIKFTPEGGEVSLSLRFVGSEFVVTVRDNGIGIASEDLPHLGNPFYQARSSYDRPYEGSGLGLSVVRGFVGLHQGRMSVESAPRSGTTVTVALPADCRRIPDGTARPATILAIPRTRKAETAVRPAQSRTAEGRFAGVAMLSRKRA